jgi:hypothetical protein
MRRVARTGGCALPDQPGLGARLQTALLEARKRRESARTLLLSTILADLKNREFELKRLPTDDEAADVLQRGVKRRREAAELYAAGQRPELEAKELAEIKMLEEFLPQQASPDEVRAAVREAIAAGAKDVGKVMGQVMPRFKGRADGKAINQIAREELAAAV